MSKIYGKWISRDDNNLTVSGTDLAVKFSDAEVPDANKVYSSEKIATISGVLSAEIDSDISTHASSADHDGRYYTETEVDGLFTTVSGDIVTQIPSIAGLATETYVDEHTWTESDIIDLGDYATNEQLTTTSGDIIAQIPNDFDGRYYTETELDAGQLDNRYYTETEVDGLFTTVSGDIVTQIPTDFYTTGEVDGLIPTDFYSQAEVTTISGDIIAQIPTDFYTTDEVDTISGALNDKIAAVGGADEIEYLTLDAGHISNKYIDLANTPITPADVMLDIIGCGPQVYGVDYVVQSGTELCWATLTLDGLLEANDEFRVSYTYSA
jgi:hypothetical protein